MQNFSAGSDQKMDAPAPLDAMRAPQQASEDEEFERQAPALAVNYLLATKLPNLLLTQLYCIA